MSQFHTVVYDQNQRMRAISRPFDWVTALQKRRQMEQLGLTAEVLPTDRGLRLQRAELEREAPTAPPIPFNPPDAWPDEVVELTDKGWEFDPDREAGEQP